MWSPRRWHHGRGVAGCRRRRASGLRVAPASPPWVSWSPRCRRRVGSGGAPRGPAFHGPQTSAVKIGAGWGEGRWACEGHGYRWRVLISERGLGARHRDRGSELLAGLHSFRQTREGDVKGTLEPRALTLRVDLTHAAFL